VAGLRQRSNGTWEAKFQKKGILDRPVTLNFKTQGEALRFSARAEEALRHGVVVAELQRSSDTVRALMGAYAETPGVRATEKMLAHCVALHTGATSLREIDYNWVERWVARLREQYAPSSITKRVGCLARALDWGMRTGLVVPGTNPLRLLPRSYATLGKREQGWMGARDRRLEPSEETAIRATLRTDEERLLFTMALETAMRLSEMTTLTRAQIDLKQRTIFLSRTKNGTRRQVPITSTLAAALTDWLSRLNGQIVFPSWGTDPAKSRASHVFGARIREAGVKNFRFHDLRHEATTRFYLRTSLTDVQIASITGHKNLRMLQRYANLRGSELAQYLW
jgi:integrase